jgi:hypothetical protein
LKSATATEIPLAFSIFVAVYQRTMRGVLIWALLILVGESLLRLVCWSLLFILPMSVWQSWRTDSAMKWVTTVLTIGLAVFLLMRRRQLARSAMAKMSWLLVALLTCISVVAFGTERRVGYTILQQPTSRLAHMVAIGSFVAAGVTYWRLIEKRKKSQRLGVALTGFAGSLAFVPGIFRDISFEALFAGGGLLRPAGIAMEFLLPSALVAGLALSFQSWNTGDVPLIRQKWFEFLLIVLAAVMGLSTMARLYQ